MSGHEKDAVLDELAGRGNVAQFVSFGPDGSIRFNRIRDLEVNREFSTPQEAVDQLLVAAPEGRVNVRSFDPRQPRGHPFDYGLDAVASVMEVMQQRWSAGLHTIVNETIDVDDGGVSGVAHGTWIEFAPGTTPRGVEQVGATSLPMKFGWAILRSVYGVEWPFQLGLTDRVEFSLHPVRRGVRQGHLVLWEWETQPPPIEPESITWPNSFSRFLGDKCFGLLVAQAGGFRVPRTQAIARGIRPFEFGSPTGSGEVWLRTCPREQVPGKFATLRGWTDPFALMQSEDPDGVHLASVLVQDSVASIYSGATMTNRFEEPVVQGTAGFGDAFMLGAESSQLPSAIVSDVTCVWESASNALGPVEFEWAHDGQDVWVLQLHRRRAVGDEVTLVPGNASHWIEFKVSDFPLEGRLDVLHRLIARAKESEGGVLVVGRVGVTSHLGQALRASGVPARMRWGGIESENPRLQIALPFD